MFKRLRIFGGATVAAMSLFGASQAAAAQHVQDNDTPIATNADAITAAAIVSVEEHAQTIVNVPDLVTLPKITITAPAADTKAPGSTANENHKAAAPVAAPVVAKSQLPSNIWDLLALSSDENVRNAKPFIDDTVIVPGTNRKDGRAVLIKRLGSDNANAYNAYVARMMYRKDGTSYLRLQDLKTGQFVSVNDAYTPEQLAVVMQNWKQPVPTFTSIIPEADPLNVMAYNRLQAATDGKRFRAPRPVVASSPAPTAVEAPKVTAAPVIAAAKPAKAKPPVAVAPVAKVVPAKPKPVVVEKPQAKVVVPAKKPEAPKAAPAPTVAAAPKATPTSKPKPVTTVQQKPAAPAVTAAPKATPKPQAKTVSAAPPKPVTVPVDKTAPATPPAPPVAAAKPVPALQTPAAKTEPGLKVIDGNMPEAAGNTIDDTNKLITLSEIDRIPTAPEIEDHVPLVTPDKNVTVPPSFKAGQWDFQLPQWAKLKWSTPSVPKWISEPKMEQLDATTFRNVLIGGAALVIVGIFGFVAMGSNRRPEDDQPEEPTETPEDYVARIKNENEQIAKLPPEDVQKILIGEYGNHTVESIQNNLFEELKGTPTEQRRESHYRYPEIAHLIEPANIYILQNLRHPFHADKPNTARAKALDLIAARKSAAIEEDVIISEPASKTLQAIRELTQPTAPVIATEDEIELLRSLPIGQQKNEIIYAIGDGDGLGAAIAAAHLCHPTFSNDELITVILTSTVDYHDGELVNRVLTSATERLRAGTIKVPANDGPSRPVTTPNMDEAAEPIANTIK